MKQLSTLMETNLLKSGVQLNTSETSESHLPQKQEQNSGATTDIVIKNNDGLLEIPVVQDLISKLTDIYNTLMERNYKEKTPEDYVNYCIEWQDALKGFTKKMVANGIRKCKNPYGQFSVYPPNMIQFALLCLPNPEELGVPNARDSFKNSHYEAMMYYDPAWNQEPRPFSHELIHNTIERIGYRRFKNMHEEEAWKDFEEVYRQEVKEFMLEYYYSLRKEDYESVFNY